MRLSRNNTQTLVQGFAIMRLNHSIETSLALHRLTTRLNASIEPTLIQDFETMRTNRNVESTLQLFSTMWFSYNIWPALEPNCDSMS